MMRSRCAKAVAKVMLSLLPLARSNSGPSASTMDFTAPALRTLIVGIRFLSFSVIPGHREAVDPESRAKTTICPVGPLDSGFAG